MAATDLVSSSLSRPTTLIRQVDARWHDEQSPMFTNTDCCDGLHVAFSISALLLVQLHHAYTSSSSSSCVPAIIPSYVKLGRMSINLARCRQRAAHSGNSLYILLRSHHSEQVPHAFKRCHLCYLTKNKYMFLCLLTVDMENTLLSLLAFCIMLFTL